MIRVPKVKIRTRRFSYNGLVIQVLSDKPSHLVWLEEFLSPQFDTGDKSPSYDCKVQLTIDGKQYNQLLRREPKSARKRIDTFALDSRMIDLPFWKSSNDERIIFDEGSKVFYRLNPEGTHVRIITPVENIFTRKVLMRVVREFVMNHSHITGDLVIHGAAFSYGNKGVIIAGPKHSGKTSLLIHALRQKGIRFAANDRVIVSFDTGMPVMRGLPTIVKLRQKTLEMFPGLKQYLLSKKYDYHLTLEETKSGLSIPAQPDRHGDLSMSPIQLCQSLRARQVAKANVHAVVFPRHTSVRGKIRLKELPAELAAKRLMDSLFRAGSKRLVSSAFTLGKDNIKPNKKILKKLCLHLGSQVRCLDCYLGLDAYNDESTASKFTERLLK